MEKDIFSKASIPPFISIDEEGGRVERTEYIHPRRFSAKFAFEKGKEFLTQQTIDIAEELADLKFNLNFAPVADVNTNPNNPIIGERAYSNKPQEVIEAVNLVSDVYKKYGIIPCIKHYPGHGDANSDSHKTLPDINLSMDEMLNYHIKPFKECIKHGVDMIMAAHLHCTCFDTDVIPTSLSKNALSYLRQNLDYKGVIISDDMVMKNQMQRDISTKGYYRIDESESNVENKTTLNTVNVYLLSMGLSSDLVTTGLMTKNTLKGEI